MITPWLLWLQQTGGQEGVCMSEVTIPIKWTKQKTLMLWAWINFAQDEGNDVMNKCVLASGGTAPLSSMMNDEIPVRGNKLAAATLRDATASASQTTILLYGSWTSSLAQKRNTSEHWNTQNTVILSRLMTWILLKTHTHITHTCTRWTGMLLSTTHTNDTL